MPTRRAELRHAVLLLVAAAAAAGAALVAGAGVTAQVSFPSAGPQVWRGLLGARPAVALGGRMIVVLRTPSLAQRVARHPSASPAQERAWVGAVHAAQQQLLSRLAVEDIAVHPDFRFTNVLDGFSAAVDASDVPAIERDADVVGVYPVRAVYPATLAGARVAAASPLPQLAAPGLDGHGIRVAVLDTGVDPAVPTLHGRVRRGIDLLGGDANALAASNPDDPSQVERHGTEMAGIVVGIAPGASVVPIRVAGWQPDALGHFAIYGRSDQLLAGLDRAVDLNGDGDAHDAARIALVALAEPFAAFADGPEARAVAGATALGTLVIAAAGNDGVAASAYGDVSGPAAAPDALAVGATDLRATTTRVHVVVRTGLQTLFDATPPLAGAVAPAGRIDVSISTQRAHAATGDLTAFFSSEGDAIVAGRAALVPAGASPETAAERAVSAGASAVLLYGGAGLPPGGLGVDVPAVSIPTGVARAVVAALAAGRSATVALQPSGSVTNLARGRVAAFSSSGLAFDGRVKPDLVAPGVGLVTADPGSNADGSPRLVTVNGSSAAAASAAGAAALLAQARPELTAAELHGVLVAGAQPIDREAVTVQGAGGVDVQASVRAKLAASPATLALSRARDGSFELVNVSLIARRVELASVGRATVTPTTVVLAPGARVRVRLRRAGAGAATGVVVARTTGGGALRVPWALAASSTSVSLLERVRISERSFTPSDTAPALLSLDAGRVLRVHGFTALRPLERLDVRLLAANGSDLGLLARLREVLPGRYAFGLTGRGADGRVLAAGRYAVRVLAYPVDGGPPTARTVRFVLR